MKLSAILEHLRYEKTIGAAEVEITGINTDSRKVCAGELFICYRGGKRDSHDYAEEAVRRGAAALICERKLDIDITQIIVSDGRAAMADAARIYYGFPDKKLKIVGITGTNGKTTTAFMLKSIFDANGNKTGIIGTLGIKYCEKNIAPELTTPDPIFLYFILSDMARCGVEIVFMEVSAHALYLKKVEGITFETGIFTNCTQDHLDFFENMSEYSKAKKKLFEDKRCKYVVTNSDDGLGVELLGKSKNVVSYGIKNPADVFAVDISENIDGASYVLNLFDELYEINLKLPAIHNVYNSMAAAACAKLLGVETAVIAKGLAALERVDGRLELIARYNGAEIFVDFAHTPDGLEKSLRALKKLCKNKLYCLFGCGGDRDKSKRPIMGEVAGRCADFCIITSDNPRFEDPYDIIAEVEGGMKKITNKYVTVTERDIATEYAIRLLDKGDILLVAGKGGEEYQEIMGIKHSYNDNKVIKNIIGG